MKDTICLALQKADLIEIIESLEKRSQNDKLAFLKSIPELANISMTRSKLLTFCSHLFPVEFVKTQVIYNEGDQCKYLYLIRQGEVQISTKVTLPNKENEQREDFVKILEDPSQGRKSAHMVETAVDSKTHVFGTVSAGFILGLEEAVLGKRLVHNTSAICISQKLKVYKIEREVFVQRLQNQKATWKNLVEKSTSFVRNVARSISNFKRSNLKIIDRMRKD